MDGQWYDASFGNPPRGWERFAVATLFVYPFENAGSRFLEDGIRIPREWPAFHLRFGISLFPNVGQLCQGLQPRTP